MLALRNALAGAFSAPQASRPNMCAPAIATRPHSDRPPSPSSALSTVCSATSFGSTSSARFAQKLRTETLLNPSNFNKLRTLGCKDGGVTRSRLAIEPRENVTAVTFTDLLLRFLHGSLRSQSPCGRITKNTGVGLLTLGGAENTSRRGRALPILSL
jgi:hypothetical protein